jgi:hypothetical protein
MAVGFLGYLSSLVLLIVYGIRPDGSVRTGPALRYGALAVFMFLLWLGALSRA